MNKKSPTKLINISVQQKKTWGHWAKALVFFLYSREENSRSISPSPDKIYQSHQKALAWKIEIQKPTATTFLSNVLSKIFLAFQTNMMTLFSNLNVPLAAWTLNINRTIQED